MLFMLFQGFQIDEDIVKIGYIKDVQIIL